MEVKGLYNHIYLANEYGEVDDETYLELSLLRLVELNKDFLRVLL